MFLTIDKTNENDETFEDCFNYLLKVLPTHYLLRQDEREKCEKAVIELKKVFARFYDEK